MGTPAEARLWPAGRPSGSQPGAEGGGAGRRRGAETGRVLPALSRGRVAFQTDEKFKRNGEKKRKPFKGLDGRNLALAGFKECFA